MVQTNNLACPLICVLWQGFLTSLGHEILMKTVFFLGGRNVWTNTQNHGCSLWASLYPWNHPVLKAHFVDAKVPRASCEQTWGLGRYKPGWGVSCTWKRRWSCWGHYVHPVNHTLYRERSERPERLLGEGRIAGMEGLKKPWWIGCFELDFEGW